MGRSGIGFVKSTADCSIGCGDYSGQNGYAREALRMKDENITDFAWVHKDCSAPTDSVTDDSGKKGQYAHSA